MFWNNKKIIELIENDDFEKFEKEFSKKKDKTEKITYLKFTDWTYLHIACYNESIGIVKSIFNIFPDFPVDIQDDRGLTPLVRSIAKENCEMVKFLISKGASLDVPMNGDLKAIHFALQNGNTDLRAFCINEYGIDNLDNLAFISIAQILKVEEIKHLRTLGVEFDPLELKEILIRVILSDDSKEHILENLRYFLDLKFDPNEEHETWGGPIYQAIEKGYLECVKLLIAHGAKIHFENIETESITPLDVAFAHEQLEIASYLISLEAHHTTLTDPEDVERLKKKSHHYELQFTGVNELKKERIKYYFLEYTWAGGFDVTSHEFKETENELTIVFNSLKHFSPPREQEESDSQENMNDNLFHKLIGKEQFFCHLSYDEKANLDDTTKAYFIDQDKKKWSAEISKYSRLSEVG
jgi:ankyrin repeat protein